jgi:alpha/beta superfamily hydrolase
VQPASVDNRLTRHRKTDAMEAQSQLKPALWGAVGGAIALAIIGFSWGGWVTGSKADALARQQVQAALIEVLTPICVDKFYRAENAQARLVEFKKMTSSLDRERFVRENAWAKFGKESNSRVVDACATELYKL